MTDQVTTAMPGDETILTANFADTTETLAASEQLAEPEPPGDGLLAALVLLGLVGLVNAACGLVVAAKRPRLWIGALLTLIGFIATQQILQTSYDHAYGKGLFRRRARGR